MRFDKLGVFEYSKEDGTPAAKMPNQISPLIKKRRKNIIMRLQRDITRESLKNYIGQKIRVIVDGQIDSSYCGRGYMDAYEIDGLIFFNADYEIISGEFVDVLVTSAADYDLYAELVK
jgi:ribosomal protein S12 methylthiotransferase